MNSSTALLAVVDRICETRKITSHQGRWYYVQAVRALEKLLSRTAVVSDLSIEAISPLRSRFQRYLILVWAEAYRRRAIDARPEDRKGFQFFRLINAKPGAGMTLAEFVKNYTEANLSIQTVKRLSLALDRPATVSDLTDEIIKAFIAEVCDANPSLKAGGVREREGLRSIWWAAYRTGLAISPGEPVASPGERVKPWDCLPAIMQRAPPIVLDKLPKASKTLSLTDFLERYYYPCRPGISPKTIKEYANSVCKLERYLNRPAVLSDLNNQSIGSYLAALTEAGQSRGTIAKERAQLLAFWRHAHNAGMLIVGPLIQPIRTSDKVPTALTIDQLKRLRRAIPEMGGQLGGVKRSLLMAACLSIQYVTGARLGAVLALRFDDIKNGVITFRAENRKFGKEPIVKKLPPWVSADIDALRSSNRPRLFPEESTVAKFASMYDQLFNRAGVDRPKGKSSHLLRSTHATMVWLDGGDPTASLGHSSEATTINSYLDRRFKPDESFNFLPDLGGDADGR